MSTIEPPRPAPDQSADLRHVPQDPDVEIRMLSTAAEMVEVVDVFKEIWGSVTEIVRLEMLMAISHSGGYVAAAYDTRSDRDTILGASVGLLARFEDRPAMHSHVTGVLPEVRRTGLGRSLKLNQQRWAAERGIESIVWTFDPLVRRNAWFNIAVLGAEVRRYLPSFYGEMTDAINAGDESDRLFVAWRVPIGDDLAVRDGSGWTGTDLVPTPEDVVALRTTDVARVARWRRETREALTTALDAGRRVVGFTRDGEYVIGPPA